MKELLVPHHLRAHKWFYAAAALAIAMLTLLKPTPHHRVAAPSAQQLGAADVAPAAATVPPADVVALPPSTPYDAGSEIVAPPAPTPAPEPDEPAPPPSQNPPPPPAPGYTCANDASLPAPILATVLNAIASVQPDAATALAPAFGCTASPASVTPATVTGLSFLFP